MKSHFRFLLITSLCVLFSCSSEQESNNENVFKTQTDAIKKAEEVEDKILDAVEKQKKAIEDQSR